MTKQTFLKLITLITMLLSAPMTFAHAKSVSANPAPRSVITRSPESINILFSQQLEPTYSTIIIKNYHHIQHHHHHSLNNNLYHATTNSNSN